MAAIYNRTCLAQEMARQLLRPKILDLPMRSGLFLTGLDRTGTATFLRNELIPALESLDCGGGNSGRRAFVIYVDLSSEVNASPAQIMLQAVRAKLHELAVNGFRFTYDMSSVGAEHGVTLAEALRQVVDETRTDLVLLVDEIQECLRSEDSRALLKAVKATRDAINLRPSTPAYFLFVCAGSQRTLLENMTVGPDAAFSGAAYRDF